jgi:hypothetical protein
MNSLGKLFRSFFLKILPRRCAPDEARVVLRAPKRCRLRNLRPGDSGNRVAKGAAPHPAGVMPSAGLVAMPFGFPLKELTVGLGPALVLQTLELLHGLKQLAVDGALEPQDEINAVKVQGSSTGIATLIR